MIPIPDGFVDIVRKGAYPIDAPEGEEYERTAVRGFLDAIDNIKRNKDRHGLALQAARDETRAVFAACMEASGL